MAKLKVIWNKYVKLKKEASAKTMPNWTIIWKKQTCKTAPESEQNGQIQHVFVHLFDSSKSHLRTALQVTLLDF